MSSATQFLMNLKSSIISKKESYGYTKEEQYKLISDIDEKIKKGKPISISSPDYFHSSEFNGEIWGIGIPESKEDLKIQLRLERASNSDCKCKIAIYPFAKGCVRTAYHGKVKMNGSDKWTDMIFKEYIIPKDRNVEEYKNQSENSAFVSYLADLYCKTHSTSKNIKGLKSRVIKVKNFLGKSNVLFNMEEKLEDSFKKWNSNGGFICEYNKDLFSFAKWTHTFSDGYLLVADLQGIETSNDIALTDPAVLCTDMKRFGVTNLGSSGIEANLEALNKNLNNNIKSATLSKLFQTIRPGKSRIEDERLIVALDRGFIYKETEVDVMGLIPIIGCCCFISSLYGESDCFGCFGSQTIFCIEGTFKACKPPKHPEHYLICLASDIKVTRPTTCIKLVQQIFYFDSRCAFPCDYEVPCILNFYGFTCFYKGQCNANCCKKIGDIDVDVAKSILSISTGPK